MTTRITTSNIETTTLAQLGGPKITNIEVTDNSYTVLDDTAVDVAGGYILITGTGFESGCQVVVNNTAATSVTFVSATQVRAQVPATAAGTYIVYLINPTGGVAIRVNGITFSGTPTWVSGSALAGEVDTAISIQLTATEATTFALAAGSTLPPGVTLSSGGLLSGTITGITEETVYNFTINAIDSELQDSPRSFAFTVTSGDQYFNLTTLLLPGSATTFVQDASANNFAVSVAGDTRPNTFNPYLTGWSYLNSGTGNTRLSIANNAALQFGTGDFTVEFWAYITGQHPTDSYTGVLSFGGVYGTANTCLEFTMVPNGGLEVVSFTNTTANFSISLIDGNSGLLFNRWNHFAVSRSGTTVRGFTNGVLRGTVTGNSTNINGTGIGAIMFQRLDSSVASTPGYLSNVQALKGTALYTAAFTPPTEPLTAIANTSLLTCQSNRFIDNSTNNFAITRTGDVAVGSFSPFVEPATTGGSAYFDGDGDRLSFTGNNSLVMGTGDFTIEWWQYLRDLPDVSNKYFVPLFIGTSTSTQYIFVRFNPLNGQLAVYASGAATLASNSDTFSYAVRDVWVHYAVVRSSSVSNLYANGVLLASAANSTDFTLANPPVSIGSYPNGSYSAFNGYISDLRIVKGTALYTAAFTPPAQPLTAVAGTSLLTLQTNQPVNNSQFLDSSTNNLLVTRAGNTTQGTSSPYSPAGWSNYFNGSSYLDAGGPGYNFSTNWTFETWFYATAAGMIFDSRPVSVNGYYPTLGISSTQIGITINANDIAVTPPTGVLNAWNHVAYVKNNGVFTVYFNGTSIYSVNDANTWGMSAGRPRIGANGGFFSASNGYYTGYVSNLRIVNGTAVYTANFTPSTTPLTAVAGTSLLTCQSSGFADLSPNRSAITRAGDVRVTNFAPFKAVTQTPVSYSAYFDGSEDYIQVGSSNTGVTFGTADFTIEAWVYWNSLSSESAIMVGNGVGWTFYVYPANKLQWGTTSPQSGANLLTGNTTLNTGTWYHIAVTRASGTVTLWVNGVSDGTVADSANYSASGDLRVGRSHSGQSFNGYMSNVRVVKGTAVYTEAFTPSTAPLTAIANTSLLTCQSATFIDNSTNNFAITAAGNSQPTQVNPFGSASANSGGYTASEYSGSMSFDGTGDYLDIASNAAFGFGTGDYTIEFWLYLTAIPSSGNKYTVLDFRPSGTSVPHTVYVNNSAGTLYLGFFNGTADVTTSSQPLTANSWFHCVYSRSSGTLRIYANGIQAYSAANTIDYLSSRSLRIGAGIGNLEHLFGYISNLRIVKGQALYTANFVPPIAPVQPVANTVLLLDGTNAAVTDTTTRNNLETVGDAKISTAVSKFGGSSMYFDGSGDYLRIPASPNFVFGTGNFTVELWLYVNAFGTLGQLFDTRPASTNGAYPLLYLNSDATVRLWLSSADRIISSPIVINTWYHVALSRSSGFTRLFINGVQSGSTYTDSTNYLASDVFIGASFSGGASIANFLNGYIQDLRITKHARYTADFTPPVTAFQTR